MRVIVYTGKGGVGKTSLAAASAVRAAELGHKTLVFSTDIAHSLADCFDVPLGAAPVAIAPNLWGQEMTVGHELDRHWTTIRNWLASVLAWRGMDEVLAEEMAVLPGMEELASLLYVEQYHTEGAYDVMVVDAAPTGETIRLLSFPDVIRWWMERLYPIERRVATLVRPLLRPLNIPLPENEVFDSIEALYRKLYRMRAILTNDAESSIRLVVNAEKMVIKEAQRTYTYMGLYGYHTDLVICNRLIPAEVEDGYFAVWKEAQQRYLQMIEDAFSPLPILKMPLMGQEIVGLPMLRRVADVLFGDGDPTAFFYRGRGQELRKEDGSYILSLALPFASKESVALSRHGDELLVEVGAYRRTIVLPQSLLDQTPRTARMQGDRLEVVFADDKGQRR